MIFVLTLVYPKIKGQNFDLFFAVTAKNESAIGIWWKINELTNDTSTRRMEIAREFIAGWFAGKRILYFIFSFFRWRHPIYKGRSTPKANATILLSLISPEVVYVQFSHIQPLTPMTAGSRWTSKVEMITGEVCEIWFKIFFLVSHNNFLSCEFSIPNLSILWLNGPAFLSY